MKKANNTLERLLCSNIRNGILEIIRVKVTNSNGDLVKEVIGEDLIIRDNDDEKNTVELCVADHYDYTTDEYTTIVITEISLGAEFCIREDDIIIIKDGDLCIEMEVGFFRQASKADIEALLHEE